MLTLEQRSAIYERVDYFVELGNEKLEIELPKPYVRFDKKGTCGGTATYNFNIESCEINLNAGLIVDNWEEFMNQVIPHEVAHLLKNHKYGRGKGMLSSHGYYWQHVMRELGVNPDRTHNMNVDKVKQAPRTKTKHIYMCPCCNRELVISQVRHNKMLRGRARYSHCNGQTIEYVRTLGKVTNSEAIKHKRAGTTPAKKRKAPAKKTFKAPAAGTKIAHAMEIYKSCMASGLEEHHTRQSIIAAIANSMQIEPHAAAGYYQNCKKRIG